MMSNGVINIFEMVQIDKQERHEVFRPSRPFDRIPKPVKKQTPVGQSGELIIVR